MPPLNYSKWDNIDDSDDEDVPASTSSGAARQQPVDSSHGASRTAEVRAGFVVCAPSRADGEPLYINVCSSNVVADEQGHMSAKPSGKGGLTASQQLQIPIKV